MTCGLQRKTCLVVGDVDVSYLPFIQCIIDSYGWRVLHLGVTDQALWDHPQYHFIQGNPDDELLMLTLFIQYDFCAVVEINLLTMVVEDVARKQWHDEFKTHRYLRMGSGVINSEVVDRFLCDTSFDSSVLSRNLTTVLGLLDTATPLPVSLPFF